MGHNDRDRWNSRYRDGFVHLHKPDPGVLDLLRALKPSGLAVDIACGPGRHTLWLANHGWEVDALDIADVAIDGLQRLIERDEIRGIYPYRIDLDKWYPNSEKYILALMAYFWDEHVFVRAQQALQPGGQLIIRTFVDSGNLLGPHNHYVDPNSPHIAQIQKDWMVWHWDIDQKSGLFTLGARKPSTSRA